MASHPASEYRYPARPESGALVTVAIAAAVALHKGGAGRVVVVAACLSTVFAAHTAPAAIGLVAPCACRSSR